MTSVLVLGFYDKGNIGDELFKSAFKKLLPESDFIFVDKITNSELDKVSTVFIGGGSFVYAAPNIESGALDKLLTKNILYLGVGIEGTIHPTHQELMRSAKLIVTRSKSQLDNLLKLNNNSRYFPDLVYLLADDAILSEKKPKSILVLPNILLAPNNADMHWKHIAWEYFKSEFSQFLDVMVNRKYTVDFFPMCVNKHMHDNWAAIEIINRMNNRNTYCLLDQLTDFKQITETFSKYEVIITQRYHGIVLSEICKTPYIAIHHHDKLKNSGLNDGYYMSFYQTTKNNLISYFNESFSVEKNDILPIERDVVEGLKKEILLHVL